MILIMLGILTGCSIVEPLLGASKDTAKLAYYKSTNVDQRVFNANLSVVEKVVVQDAINDLESSVVLIKWYVDHPTEILKGKDDYVALKESYLDVRRIVLNHKEEYSAIDLRLLSEVDVLVRSLDENLKESGNVLADNKRLVKVYKAVALLIKITKFL